MLKWIWKIIFGKIFTFFKLDDDLEDKQKKENILFNLIKSSSTDSKGRISSTRIQAFMTMSLIYIFTFVFIIIELSNAYHIWPKSYIPSSESIIVFSMILAHHIAILFHKIRENKFIKSDNDQIKGNEIKKSF